MSLLKQLSMALCLLAIACNGLTVPDSTSTGTDGGSDGSSGTTADTDTGTDTETGGTTGEGESGGTSEGGLALSGQIVPAGAAKTAPRAQVSAESYMVVAQSDATGEIYRGTTDSSGNFQVSIPDAEAGNTFMTTILGPDGRAVGPVVFGTAEDDGITGLDLDGEVSLGTIALPDDLAADAIAPGSDADDLDGLIDPNLAARLDENGVPVGLASHGKGEEAENSAAAAGRLVDADEDGLIDMLDADDDGDGVVDDFEGEGDVGGLPADIHVNFFMNLKIQAEQAEVYYSGSEAEIAAALAVDTIITFECVPEPSATRTITAVEALETPGPTYMPDTEKMIPEGDGGGFSSWAELDYAFDEASDRFQAFVRPNAVMDAGDTFTIEVTFDDATTEQYSRMINYVFKNIPKLVQYGAAEALSDFDVTDPGVNGSSNQPIHFDGTQDLVLVFEPPLDETGAYLTDLDYTFQIFYDSATDGSQLNEQIDTEATWPDPPAGFEGTTYSVSNAELELSAENTYTFTLPKVLFPDTVQTTSGTQQAVAAYKIDITAECSSGNAAIMLMFEKQ